MRKSNEELLQELSDGCISLDAFFATNAAELVNEEIPAFWKTLIEKSGMSKTAIINCADFNYGYFFDIINGRKIPSRDKLLRIIVAMQCTVDDCQSALRISGKSALYPRVRRDSIIIYALTNRLPVSKLHELLIRFGERPLR